ncbi:hypothetical protein JCM17207_10910 [Faecalibacterium gallinarum]|uniref:Uncharacterized protein n=1 Tax=Faecalibacterium gallinarum TaxID=2903556 RepID=A0AA37IY56_9FIRM|nr:hypothetical protein JCM17207_10910 [Faecalibacterium gallinarum]
MLGQAGTAGGSPVGRVWDRPEGTAYNSNFILYDPTFVDNTGEDFSVKSVTFSENQGRESPKCTKKAAPRKARPLVVQENKKEEKSEKKLA